MKDKLNDMIRYMCLLVFATSTNTQDLDSIFGAFNNGKPSLEDLKCSSIKPVDGGVWSECYNCFPCDHPKYLEHFQDHGITRRLMFNEKCNPFEVCCVNQLETNYREGGINCGTSNPEGEPRSVRPALRSVLPGQYPWRAWIYGDNKKLCGATYISFRPEVLVTTATCLSYILSAYNIYGYMVVRFEKDSGREAQVESMKIHPDYDSTKNDIALIKLKSPVQSTYPVCRPQKAPQVGTTCVVITEKGVSVSAVIVPQKECNNTEGVMCAMVPRDDFIPEISTGLFCLDQTQKDDKYYLHGIILSNVQNVLTYTKISDYDQWITKEINLMKNTP